MINQINSQRSSMKQPLLCQDSLLTSLAQQHANDMAALDQLSHDLSCSSPAIPTQFCSSSNRLAPYGPAVENIIALTGNDGSASAAMAQFNASPGQFSLLMNPDYLYVGVGMAMNAVSGKYYWVQVFSAGNYQGVNCTIEPAVTVLDAYNRTSTFLQPINGLKLSLYPAGIADNSSNPDLNANNNNNNSSSNGNSKFYCTMIPNPGGPSGSALPLGKLPYPTISFAPKSISSLTATPISGIIASLNAALSMASATIIGPSSQILVPVIEPTSSTSTSTLNPASMLATFSPTNSSQSSLASAMSSMMADPSMSSMMANPTMTSAALQMAQFMAAAATTTTTTTNS